ncbi:YoaK family protein [Archangium sp.]|uniref:YoaK family protein n=1 Tax=Archangium sp. TaxID=1872627 RepID=UPI002D6A6510|nr:YoaK family protein [Archangium sp.]HYO54759.1 YoaK family protein [Archangium sp.]
MFSAATSRRSRLAYSTLALLLAGAAGAINATSFFAFGQHITHMTGHVTAVGEAVASGQWGDALTAGQMVFAFVVGAVTATALLDASRHRTRGRHAAALLVEVVTLGGVGLWVHEHPDANESTLMWGLAFAMGLQNALVTRVSGAVVRTTHLTGVLTDIGIQLVRMVVWVRDGARERGLRGIWHKVLDLPSAEQFERTRLHLGLALAFLTGSILGTGLYLRYGASAMALPCVVLVVVMALDISPAGSRAPAASL